MSTKSEEYATRMERKRIIKKQRKEQRARYISKHPEGNRNSYYKINYGIDIETYKSMFLKQHGVCAICGKAEKTKRLAVDHDHATKKVRGLLCQKCNVGLGYFEDNISLLERAANYLVI